MVVPPEFAPGRRLRWVRRALSVIALGLLFRVVPEAAVAGDAWPRAVALGVARPGATASEHLAEAVAGGWRWPLAGVPRVVRPFDPPTTPFGPGHRGVDLAAEPGATVRTAGAGIVWFAGAVGGRGVVSVHHADGQRTTYEPVHPAVRAGALVAAGTPLGTLAVGHPGCRVSVAACLHWGLRAGSEYRDPLSLLGPGQVRLYPLSGG